MGRLAQRPRRRVQLANFRESAVLVPLIETPADAHPPGESPARHLSELLYIVRTTSLPTHAGQVAFLMMRPDQGDGFSEVADIVVGEAEEIGIDAGLGEAAGAKHPHPLDGDDLVVLARVDLDVGRLALEAAGADVIELGLPFSDPLADGIVNQMAADRALKAGATTPKVLELIRRLKDRGASVRAVMTAKAAHFVTPLSVGALTGDKSLWNWFLPGDLWRQFSRWRRGEAPASRTLPARPRAAELWAQALPRPRALGGRSEPAPQRLAPGRRSSAHREPTRPPTDLRESALAQPLEALQEL